MTQAAQATYDDANLIMRLYDLRREEKLREARAWFVANFKPKTMADIEQLCPRGSNEDARLRQVASYWDMAASFVTAGVLNPELFFASSREMLVVAVRFRPVLADIRIAFKDPTFLRNLEVVGQQFSDYLDKAGPGTLEAFVARVGG
jgi:hypothetical protein